MSNDAPRPALQILPANTGMRCQAHRADTLLRCSHCSKPICPRCTRSGPVGQLCPQCAPTTVHVQGSRRLWLSLAFAGIAALALALSFPAVREGVPQPHSTAAAAPGAPATVALRSLAAGSDLSAPARMEATVSNMAALGSCRLRVTSLLVRPYSTVYHEDTEARVWAPDVVGITESLEALNQAGQPTQLAYACILSRPPHGQVTSWSVQILAFGNNGGALQRSAPIAPCATWPGTQFELCIGGGASS